MIVKSPTVNVSGRLLEVAYVEDGHQYLQFDSVSPWQTRPLLSVTQACHEGGLSDPEAVARWNDESRQRGTDIHEALLYYFTSGNGTCGPINASLGPYWEPVMDFLRDGGFEVESAEQIVFEPDVYAGRYDFVGRLAKFKLHDDPALDPGRDLIDVKTGSLPASVGPQTMAYRRRHPHQGLVRRWALHVSAGNYRLVPLNTDPQTGLYLRANDLRDERVFLAAVTIAQFKREHHGTRS